MALVLIIEDNPHTLATLREILVSEDHAVLEARNGKEGLALFQSRLPALVITDIIMPEKEGIETILELRRMAPACKIIAMSGGGFVGKTDFLALAKKAGADAVLEKPFGATQLLDAVAHLAPAA